MKRRVTSLLLAIALVVSSICTFSANGKVVDAATQEFDCAYAASSKTENPDYVVYGAKDVVALSDEEAQEAGVPEGYTGTVLRVDGASNRGVFLDFSAQKIATDLVDSITFRIYVSDNGTTSGYPQIRVPKPGTNAGAWLMLHSISDKTDQWIDVTLGATENTLINGTSFADISENGYLNKCELSLRGRNDATDVKFYVDSIRVNLKDNSDFDCTYQALEKGSMPEYEAYGAKGVKNLNAGEAKKAGVPEGYTGTVLNVEGGNNRGLFLDFSSKKIPTNLVKGITFRIYISDNGTTAGYPEIRIPKPGTKSAAWVMRYDISSLTDRWLDVTLGSAETAANGTGDFADISENGYLNKCELSLRGRNDATSSKYYIDSIRVNLKENDGVGPVITCGDSDTIYVFSNGSLKATAYDAMEQRDVDVEYIWPEGTVLQDNGLPTEGTYTLTLQAKDYFGNVTKKTLTVVVEKPDTIAPEIQLQIEEIHAVIGTIPCLQATATDDSGKAPVVTYTWSEGALDYGKRLQAGEHTWTVTATDTAGNKSEKSVRVIVEAAAYTNGIVVDEEALYKETYPCADGHTLTEHKQVKATCTKNGTSQYWSCDTCGKLYEDADGKTELKSIPAIKATGHKLKVVKAVAATYDKAGKREHYRCSSCGKLYSDSKGKTTTTTAKLTVPKKTVPTTSLKKVTAKKKALEVKWNKKCGVSGYQIQVATKKNFKSGVKTTQVRGEKKTTVTVKKLKGKKTYYVRIRAYKTVGKKTYYSAWSSKIINKKTK